MDRLDAMEIFVAAMEEGSLAAAARRVGRSPAAATRAVAMLEDMAGETLLLRSTRAVRLTAEGERRLAIWRDVLSRLAETRDEPSSPALGGSLVLTAPELFGRLKVMPVTEEFLDQHPGVRVRVLMLNRIVDMVAEGIDVAIRLAHLEDTTMVTAKVGEVRQLLCAAPAYLARRGEPTSPSELARHDCIGAIGEGDRELWPFATKDRNRPRSTQVQTRLSLNSAGAALDAAIRGRGVVRALSYQVADDIVAGRLRVLLAEFEPEPIPVNLLFRANPRKTSPVRRFVDFAVPTLRQELGRIAASLA